jgi:cytochrome b561
MLGGMTGPDRPAGAANRYSAATIALHWLMLALLASVYATIELRELFPRGSESRELMKSWHYLLGLSVFALVWLRLLARAAAPPPRTDPPLPRWQRSLSAATHAALYALMIAMPVAGWLMLSAAGEPVSFLGVALPPLASPSESLAARVGELHEVGGRIGYAVIGLHAAAALFHHFLLRDDVLRRMLPQRG